ncbi:MAG: hypothetical protein IPL19_30810 [Sandaracinaceae bacterium]|nr:hypothetical protein [Sandaracinaceae bacterium]
MATASGLLASACSDTPPSPPTSDIGRPDFGHDLGSDVSVGPDQTNADEGVDAATADAGMIDCEVEAPDMLGSEVGSVVQRLAIASHANDFAIVFRERRPVLDDLWVRVYRDTPDGTTEGTDYAITTDAAGMGVSSISRDPVVAATATGFVTAWIDNRDVGFEMWTRLVDADGIPATTLNRITTTGGRSAFPALTRGSDGTLLAGYVLDDLADEDTSEFFVARLDATGATAGAWARASAMGEVAVRGMLVPDPSTGFLSGWVDGSNNARVRPVNVSGAPSGSAVGHGVVTAFALNGVVLVLGRNSGFDGIWGQPITGVGAADGLLRSALANDATGRDPGVAPLNGGVVVAYRHTTVDGTMIALALLNSRGERMHTEVLGETTAQGGPVSVAVNNEGRIRLAWAEVEANVTTTFTQAIQCAEPL